MKCPICGLDRNGSSGQCGKHIIMTYDKDGNLIKVQDTDGKVWKVTQREGVL